MSQGKNAFQAGLFVEVILPLPIKSPLTYRVPSSLSHKICWGKRVIVPVKNRRAIGIVWSKDSELICPSKDSNEIKDVIDVVDEYPIVPPELKPIFEWISAYYYYPIGLVVSELLPAGLLPKSKKKIAKVERGLSKGPKRVFEAISWEKSNKITLSKEQDCALLSIKKAINSETFSPFLLFGVTGSGKTEVYIRAVEQCLSQLRGSLVLVPEIAMTSQLINRFASKFKDELAVLHSGLTEAERLEQWYKVRVGERRLVIGTRSAVCAPVSRLGLIIVDEEHDRSYKQQERLKYNARDVAVLRAKMSNATVVLGSATPSITSFYNTTIGKYKLLTLKSRPTGTKLPVIELVDKKRARALKEESFSSKKKKKLPLWLSQKLYKEIEKSLSNDQQVMLFLNRRGFAPYVFCSECGYVFKCKNCEVSLTWHKAEDSERLICHYCGFELPAPPICPKCKGSAIKAYGWGTERITKDIRNLFQSAKILRFDRDTVTPKLLDQVVRQIYEHKVDIIVGTQMITKGHDFPALCLVGVLFADHSLNFPEFNAAERTFQLLSQASGRAGRRDLSGKVIIQTSLPKNYVLEAVIKHDYLSFYKEEIMRREKFLYPPFVRIINIRITGKDEKIVEETSYNIRNFCDNIFEKQKLSSADLIILGPAPCAIVRLKRAYRWNIMLKAKSLKVLYNFIKELLPDIEKVNKNIRIELDVDPETIL